MAYREKYYYGLSGNGFHRIVYSEWGAENTQIIICVHGLTGNGFDFDFIAPELVKCGYRVIAVDLPGRGRSDVLENSLDYNYIQYCNDLAGLLAHLGVHKPASIDWLGISLGGLLGIRLAGMPFSPVRRLVLNDVGPEVPKPALDFIYDVISKTYRFDDVTALETRLRETRGLSWGPITDAQWQHMAEHNYRRLPDGGVTYAYDPKIADVFAHQPTGEADLWPFWDQISCPVLVLHGAQSIVLTSDIIEKMKKRGAGAKTDVHVFADCGHVPSLMAASQIAAVTGWLKSTVETVK